MKKRNHFRRIQKQQYKSNRYKNPYFVKTRKIPIIPIAIAVAILLLVISAFSFIFGFSGFNIKTIHVSGIEHIDEEDFKNKATEYIQKSRYLFFSNQNKYLFSDKLFYEHLREYFTFEEFQSKIKKQYLEISIVERISKLIWKTNNKLFLGDLNGIIVTEITKEEGDGEFSIFPVFVDRNNVEVKIGDQVMIQDEILNTFKFQKHLLEKGIAYRETQIDRLAGKWTSIVTDSGYDILFDFSSDVDKQAERLDILFRDTIPDQSKLKYIDLRFGDHVYYR